MLRAPICLSALLATALFALPACAADMAGKWYGRLDSEPLITINKAGPAYSASVDYPDTTKSALMPDGMPAWSQSIHKAVTRFAVAGSKIRFSIQNEITSGGDVNYERDDYSLTLSDDGRQMTGTETRTANIGSGFVGQPASITVTAIALFPTDFATRSQP
jgi:hypothetical protein